MAIPRARPGDLISVLPLGPRLKDARTTTLIKTDALEVLRLVVPQGKEIAPHKAPGMITVQCLEGRLAFTEGGVTRELQAGDLLYLNANEVHSLRGLEDASALVSIQLPH